MRIFNLLLFKRGFDGCGYFKSVLVFFRRIILEYKKKIKNVKI